MITRRHAVKLSLGSLVAALPLGTRAVAAIPADVAHHPADIIDGGDGPFWRGLSAHARREAAATPHLITGFWGYYECELIDRLEAAYPTFDFTIRENASGFCIDAVDDARDWRIVITGANPDRERFVALMSRNLTDDAFDAAVGGLVSALALSS